MASQPLQPAPQRQQGPDRPPVVPVAPNAFRVTLDVRFRDLDAIGHVNSGTIFAYAEHARVRWLVASGLAASESALPIILASAHADYHAPIPPGGQVEVAMWVSRIGSKSWDFTYALSAGALRHATVTTTQVAYDYASSRSVPLPDGMRQALAALT